MGVTEQINVMKNSVNGAGEAGRSAIDSAVVEPISGSSCAAQRPGSASSSCRPGLCPAASVPSSRTYQQLFFELRPIWWAYGPHRTSGSRCPRRVSTRGTSPRRPLFLPLLAWNWALSSAANRLETVPNLELLPHKPRRDRRVLITAMALERSSGSPKRRTTSRLPPRAEDTWLRGGASGECLIYIKFVRRRDRVLAHGP